MYKINEQTKNKTGYIYLENIRVAILNPTTNEREVRLSNVELFGRAIKATIFNENGIPEYESTNFSESPIVGTIVEKVSDDLFLYNYNNIVMLIGGELISTLENYAKTIEELSDYFDNQYQSENEIDQTINNNCCDDINSLSGVEFEYLCKELMTQMGFETHMTKTSGDGGIDLIAINHQAFLEGKYVVQCKRYTGSVGEPIIRDLYGVVCSERANKGILITTGYFTDNAINFAKDKQIELIDGKKLLKLLNQNNISFSANNLTDISNKISMHEYIMERFMDFHNCIPKIEYLQENPFADNVRATLIEKLVSYSYDATGINDTMLSSVPNDVKYLIFPEIYKQIELFQKYHNKTNKKINYLIIAHLIIKIQCLILEGKFIEAFNEYKTLLNNPKLYAKDIFNTNPQLANNPWLIECIYCLVYDIVAISLLFNNEKLTKALYTIGEDYIEIMREDDCQDFFQWRNISIYQGEHENDKIFSVNDFSKINSFFLHGSYFISKVNEYTYDNDEAFLMPYFTDSYTFEYKDDSLIIIDESKDEYARIDHIADILKKSQSLL